MQLLSTKIIKSIKLNKEESLSFDKWSRFLTIEGDNILPERTRRPQTTPHLPPGSPDQY